MLGVDGQFIEGQVDAGGEAKRRTARQGLANFLIVGLLDDAVREARERVRGAIKNAGLVFPMRRMSILGTLGSQLPA